MKKRVLNKTGNTKYRHRFLRLFDPHVTTGTRDVLDIIDGNA